MSCLNKINFTEELLALRDEEYKEFQCRLMPNVAKERVIGIRTPALRALAKRLAALPEAKAFLQDVPHTYYEENNLHGALIDYGKYSFEETLALTEGFLPLIDNWATCDMFVPKIFKKHPVEMRPKIQKWLASDQVYTVRFGVNCLMRDFLDDEFDPIHFDWINANDNEDYYVKMGVAWYYSVALVKQWDAAFAMIQKGLPDPWIQNKSIQKARESSRLTKAQKELLNQYKIKEGKNNG